MLCEVLKSKHIRVMYFSSFRDLFGDGGLFLTANIFLLECYCQEGVCSVHVVSVKVDVCDPKICSLLF